MSAMKEIPSVTIVWLVGSKFLLSIRQTGSRGWANITMLAEASFFISFE